VLVVDDDEGLLILMSETLQADGCEVTTAQTAKAAHASLEAHPPELMLLDLKLPDGSGPALVAELQRDRGTPVPFVVVTGQGDEKVAVEVMKQGALDYVMKDTSLLDLLPTVVKRALKVVAQSRALAAAQAEHRRLEREIVAASERERFSIGADLHDGLGQQLTALELMCTAMKEDLAQQPILAQRLAVMGKLLREAIAQTRFLARGLVPVDDKPDALQNGLAELVEEINALGRVRCVFDSPEPIAITNSVVAGHLYRIAQEAVNNAVKHARGRTVTIRLLATDGGLELTVIDDGVGISKTRGTRNGLGLGVMQHRANVIDGTLTITSKRGEGVVVRCQVPLKP
jgi:signal transduction histidine kinase